MLPSQVDDRVDEHSGAWGEPSVNSTMATIDMIATIAVEDLFPRVLEEQSVGHIFNCPPCHSHVPNRSHRVYGIIQWA